MSEDLANPEAAELEKQLTDGQEPPDFLTIAAEAFDKAIDEAMNKAYEMLGEEDPSQFMMDHPKAPGLARIMGYQGRQQHTVFFAEIHFVPGSPTFVVYIGEPELRDGVVGEEKPQILKPGE